jgi:hypothetical protein
VEGVQRDADQDDRDLRRFVNVVRTQLRLKMLLWLVLAVSVYLSINAISDYRDREFCASHMATSRASAAGSAACSELERSCLAPGDDDPIARDAGAQRP